RDGEALVVADHATLGRFRLHAAPGPDGLPPGLLFTENETNMARLFGSASASPYVKDAFHDFVVGGRTDAVHPDGGGTKTAAHYRLTVDAGAAVVLQLRLSSDDEAPAHAFGGAFDRVFADRIGEADTFFTARVPAALSAEQQAVVRQAVAGLLWSKQFYHYV